MKYFKLINRLSGEINECSYLQPLRAFWLDLIESYRKDNIETYVQYLGNGIYELKKYLPKK